MGIFPDRYHREKRPALRSVIKAVIATIRIRNFKENWAVSKELRGRIEAARMAGRGDELPIRRRRTAGIDI